MANTACAESGSWCRRALHDVEVHHEAIPGDFVYGDDIEVPAAEVFGGGQPLTRFDHYHRRQSALGFGLPDAAA
ncbi:hypothetical protein HYG77_32005 (plasmid) [Rhodococcus sp. ZPP]|uniref:hypothetical protein n=1 Tax=Rhodococcus sp. ZPP TaxID=2749906 RepID=UPI001AD8631F|nr:hypothetical protein [Rhodococcus sp. ZPP]QTJ70205.1 hypothetical protein HYG77_32005 [Rhodococcus sp. ZPP]